MDAGSCGLRLQVQAPHAWLQIGAVGNHLAATQNASKHGVGYLYPGIRAKGLMSVTSTHPMVKDATATSSDTEDEVSTSSGPQGPGHASSDSEDKVSASSDPQGLGHASSGVTPQVFATS